MTLPSALAGGFFTYLLGVQLAVMAVVALLCVFVVQPLTWRIDRKMAYRLGLFWTLLVTLEYWVLGDRSYSAIAAEADYAITGLLMLVNQPAGARFAPGFAGGNDLYAFATFSGQLLSLERLLIGHLPLGAASFAHKTLVTGIGFIGAYRLCRSWSKGDRLVPLLLAALFTLSHERLTIMTWSHGLGFALAPLAAYVFVRRQGKSDYLAGVALLSALQAISCTPTHSYLAVIAGVLAVAVIDDRSSTGKTLLALGISLLLVIANWHESFYAKFLIGPFTSRGSAEPALTLLPSTTFILMAVAGFALLLTRGRPVTRDLAGLAIGLFAGTAAQWAAAHLPFLGALRSINFGNMQAGFLVAATAVFVRSCAPGADHGKRVATGSERTPQAILVVVLLATSIGSMAWYKAYNALTWLSEGGLSTVSGPMGQIQAASWVPQEDVRVVSIPHRLPANVASAAGLNTFDGVYPLVLSSMEAFWNAVLHPKSVDAASAYLDISGSGVDFKCCRTYVAADFLDLELLRLANVGFILSTLPLRGPGLVPVLPGDNASLPRNTDPPLTRFLEYFRLLGSPPRVLVYSLGHPMPRAYVASSVSISDLEPNSRGFYDLAVEQVRSRGIAVHKAAWSAPFPVPVGQAEILSLTTPSPEETVIALRSGEPGVIVLNAPYSPFWRAYADGKPIPLTPANGVQMAARFPGNATSVSFRYERPLLRERLLNYFAAETSLPAAR